MAGRWSNRIWINGDVALDEAPARALLGGTVPIDKLSIALSSCLLAGADKTSPP